MATVLSAENEVIRRQVTCNGVTLGSVTGTESEAIAYFRDLVWLGLPPVDADTPRTWAAKPLLM